MSSTDTPGRRAWHLRALTIGVLVGFVAVAVGLYVGSRQIRRDQEHRLLVERTGEVGELLGTAVATTLQANLITLAAASQESGQAFQQAAAGQIGSSTTTSIALLAQQGSDWVVRQSAGTGLSTGQRLSGQRLALVRATGTKLHSGTFTVSPGHARLAVVLGAPAAPPGTAVYEEVTVDPSQPAAITQSEPFHELNVALYAGSHPVASNLLIATSGTRPLRGDTASYVVPVGDGTWLVVASARRPLSGSLANKTPVIVLLATLLIGLAMGSVVEAIGRRHDYAKGLVEERTRALRESVERLEETQQALVDSERLAALGQMAATVGHELRNPLSVLTNSMFLIRAAVSDEANDRLRRQLDTADREIAAATLIVSDLLEFSRPRAANPTPVDVPELLAEAVSVAPPPTGITVEQDATSGTQVVADRDQLRQVVLNLLTNAYDALPEGGTVTMTAATVDDYVEIAVADTGVGMSAETQAQIFAPFFSLKTKGTGLGLAVSKRIVDQHAGSLTMVSQEGQGCTALVRLPHALAPIGTLR
jgi:signal transduction histidine kinase